MYFLYRILIKGYFKLLKFAAYFRTDARQWLEGRRNISSHFKNSKTFNSQKNQFGFMLLLLENSNREDH